MKLPFKKLHPDAIMPQYATKGAAGMDIHARLDFPVVLHPGEAARVPTGLAMQLPDNMEAQVRGRSGLAFNNAIVAFNGTIDADFRGELKILIFNLSKSLFTITPGMRIAQMIVNAAVVRCRPEWTDDIEGTERGEAGFGSTGLHPAMVPVRDAHLHETITKDSLEVTGEVAHSPGYVRYMEGMGDDEVDQDLIRQQLNNVIRGKG